MKKKRPYKKPKPTRSPFCAGRPFIWWALFPALLLSGCARFERSEYGLNPQTGRVIKTGETTVTFLLSRTDLKGLLITKPDGTHIELKQAGSESQAVELVKAGADIYAKAMAAEEGGDGDPDPLPVPHVTAPQIPPLEVRERP
jgi:hypothetical protein